MGLPGAAKPTDAEIGSSLFLVFVLIFAARFGILKIIYYWRFRVKEKKYYTDFIQAVGRSGDYEEFIRGFYKEDSR